MIRHLIISRVSFQEDIHAILTGSKIYFRLVLFYTSGAGDEKKNPSFAFDPDGNGHLDDPLFSAWKGRFPIRTGMSILQFFWYSEISGEETSPCFFPQGVGWEASFPRRLQRKTCARCFLGHLVTILQRRAVSS